eukprot:758038_1
MASTFETLQIEDTTVLEEQTNNSQRNKFIYHSICDFKSWKPFIIFTVIMALTVIIFRYSLMNMAAWIIVMILLIVPCFFFCVLKRRHSTCVANTCATYTFVILIACILGSIWRLSAMCYFKRPVFDIWDTFDNPNYFETQTIQPLVHGAVLASNPHNSQPWKFNIDEANQYLDIYVDFDRQIEFIDPLYREMHIGIGCAIENAYIAAIYHGFSPNIVYWPDITNDAFVARLELASDSYNASNINMTFYESLYNTIDKRHTNRDFYDENKAIDETILQRIDTFYDTDVLRIYWFTTKQQKKQLKDLEVEATKAITEDEDQSTGSFVWVHKTCKSYKEHKDGIWYDSLAFPPDLDFMSKYLPPLSRPVADEYWLETIRKQHTTSSLFGMICVEDGHNNTQRMLVGRLWEKIHLFATISGVDMQPLNQIFERMDREYSKDGQGEFIERTHALLSDVFGFDSDDNNLDQCVFAFRAGFAISDIGNSVSARRSIDEVIIENVGSQ